MDLEQTAGLESQLSHTNCMTAGKLLNLFVPQFPYL